MKNKEEILNALREQLPNLKEKFNVKKIGLFGSFVREEQTEESDVDVLVEFHKPTGFLKFMELEDYLTEILGAKVEIVTPDALKSLIKSTVIKEVVYVQKEEY